MAELGRVIRGSVKESGEEGGFWPTPRPAQLFPSWLRRMFMLRLSKVDALVVFFFRSQAQAEQPCTLGYEEKYAATTEEKQVVLKMCLMIILKKVVFNLKKKKKSYTSIIQNEQDLFT